MLTLCQQVLMTWKDDFNEYRMRRPSLRCFASFLPLIGLVTALFCGALCGVNVILRLSLLLCFHAGLINFIPKQWISMSPSSQLVLLVVLASIPVNITPILWVYGCIIHVTEPIILFLELLLLQGYVMTFSKRVVDDWDDADPKTRALLGFSSVCYGITAMLAWSVYTEGTPIQIWCLVIVLIIIVMVHAMMVISPERILSDAAFCGLCCTAVLYLMVQETCLIRHATKPPSSWNSYEGSLFVEIYLAIISMTMDKVVVAVELLMKFMNPYFVVTMVIRLCSMLYVVDIVSTKVSNRDGENEEMDIRSKEGLLYKLQAIWESELIVRVSIIFMFTQVMVIYLYEISRQQTILPSIIHQIWPSQILLGRLLQLINVICFYTWRLFLQI